MSIQIYANNSRTVLASNIGPGDLSIQVIDSSTFPSIGGTDYMLVTLESGNTVEILKLAPPGKIGNTLIVDPAGRGWEGTTPSSFLVNSRVEGRITAGTLNNVVSVASNATAAEANLRSSADSTLQNNITTEANARSAADITLQNDITTEANLRSSADILLQNNITTETNDRSAADSTLQNNITTEANARSAADSTLQNNITTEANARSAADITLQNDITTEANLRSSADILLQNNITTETNDRSAADITLQSNINSEAGTRSAAISALTLISIQPGMIIQHCSANPPNGGYIQLLAVVQFPSNTGYPNLYNFMAAAGFPYGTGSGTFGIPSVGIGYALVSGTPGGTTVGQVISHAHLGGSTFGNQILAPGGVPAAIPQNPSAVSTAYTGGSANLAAGTNVTFWIKY